MLLHAGASLHGHEYSSAPAQAHQHMQHPPARPIPLLRSALRPLSEIADTHHQQRDVSPPPRRSFTDPAIPSPATYVTRRRPTSEIVSKKDLSVRFMEPGMSQPLPSPSATLLASDDEESVAGSDFTIATTITRASTLGAKRRKTSRRSTRYAMAQPPPQRLTKQRTLVQIRPKVLLQMQKIGDRRPTPAFDVVPSSIISGTLSIPGLTTRLPRFMGKKRPHLGEDDLLILRSEDYGDEDCDNVESDHLDVNGRELVAVVSPLPEFGDDRSEIIMEDGTVWTTDRISAGVYEFTSVDALGKEIKARWAKRSLIGPKAKATQGGADGTPLPSPSLPEYKWTFSIIDPTTRRHPILGVIVGNELEIYDTYNTLSTSSGRFPPTKPFHLSTIGVEPPSPSLVFGGEERLTELVPQRYKKLMVVTASWITLRLEGWPASLNPKMRRTHPACRHTQSGSGTTDAERRRTFHFIDRSQAPNIMASGTEQKLADKDKVAASRTGSPESGFPRRSLSTGAAFMRSRGVLAEPVGGSNHAPQQEKRPVDRSSYRPKIVHHPDQQVAGEKTHTCRIKVMKITRRLFHRKDCQTE
jgi:hypothetical protein